MPETNDTSRQTVFTGDPAQENPSGRVFRHIILFKMYPETTDELVDEALRLMVAMCNDEKTILHYEVGISEDIRKGLILFEFVDFVDEAAFNAFKTSPAHLAYANFIRSYADWVIADYSVAV